MKTQIINLQPHDDLVSVRDRMSWAKSPQILLIWPGFRRITLRPLDLRILQEHARYLGATLAIVTRSAAVRREAEAFSVPVFRSAVEAQRRAWPQPRSKRAWKAKAGPTSRTSLTAQRDGLANRGHAAVPGAVTRVVLFGLGVLSVLALAALFVPSATIRLDPGSFDREITIPVEVGSAPARVISGRIAATVLTATVEATKTAEVRTQVKIPENRATGRVRFQNLTQFALVIPAGTVVYSAASRSVRFSTTDEVALGAEVGATAEVEVAALEAGETGNVPANSIRGIEGALGTSATVINDEPLEGGSDRLTAVPSRADRERLRESLLSDLQQTAADRMVQSIAEGDVFLPGALKLKTILAEEYSPPEGEPGGLLSLTVRAEYSGEAVGSSDLRRLAEGALDAALPAGYHPVQSSLQFRVEGEPSTDANGLSQLRLQVTRTEARNVDRLRSISLVRGHSPERAVGLLASSIPLASPPQIELHPGWWPWLPLIPSRITIVAP
jgi:hypothetical protein